MKTKKQKLLNQLSDNNKQEKENKENDFYEKFKNASFFQLCKKTINWNTLLIIWIFHIIVSFFESEMVIKGFIIMIPLILTFVVLVIPYEAYIKIRKTKKIKKEL